MSKFFYDKIVVDQQPPNAGVIRLERIDTKQCVLRVEGEFTHETLRLSPMQMYRLFDELRQAVLNEYRGQC